MAQQVTCPGCQRVLNVPDSVTTAQLSCPRCLAKFANPSSPAGSSIPTTPEAGSASREKCPRCGKRVEPQFRFCPHCEAVLKGPYRGSRGGSLDDDIRRDGRGTSIILVLLAVLGGVGLVGYLFAGLGALGDSGPGLLLGVLSAILFLAGISTAIMFWRTRDDPSRRGVGRVIIGTLALAGGLSAVGCLASVAIFLFFFVACLTGAIR